MLGKFRQAIFLPKRTRDKLSAQAKGGRRPGRRTPGGHPLVAAGRDQLVTEALSVYRKQMEIYENLDEETRRQIEEDAAKAFGEAIAQRKN